MSDDQPESTDENERISGLTEVSKEYLLAWTPDALSERVARESSTPPDTGLDRRSYLLLSGIVATGAISGSVDTAVLDSSPTEVTKLGAFGYGGGAAVSGGDTTTVTAESLSLNTVTQTEDNDERESAMPIEMGIGVEAELDPGTVDWFAFDVVEGDSIVVEYERDPSVGVTGLVVYDPEGSFVEKLFVGTDSPHRMTTTADRTGTYYLQVMDVESGDGHYTFTVNPETADETDGTDDGSDDNTDDGSDDETTQSPYGETPHSIPGRIQAQEFDHGGQDVAYYDTSSENKGGEFRLDESVDVEQSNDSSDPYSVGYVGEGEWLEFAVDVTPGTYDIEARVSTVYEGRQFAVHLEGEQIGTFDVPETGGWFEWETITLSDVDIATEGEQTLRVEFLDGGVNLNWIEFSGQTPYGGTLHPVPGRIQAQEFDEGGQNVAYYDTSTENQGGAFRPEESVDIEESGDSTNPYNVGFVGEGEWLEFTLDVTPGTYDIAARVSTDFADRRLGISLDGERLGTFDVSDTDGWYSWETITLPGVEIEADGMQTLRVEFIDGGVNLNWIELAAASDEQDDDYGTQAYGEYGYGGITN